MANENMSSERNEQLVEFIQKIDSYYGNDEGRKKWYELIAKRPEIISADFFEMVNPLSGSQIDKVRSGLEAGLDIETIKIYAKPEFHASEIMHEILKGILSGIELDKIRLYAKVEFEGWIHHLNDIAKMLDMPTIKKYLDLELSVMYRVNILLVLMKNPNVIEERVEVLCDNCWNIKQFDKLLLYVNDYQAISLEQLKIIANPKFDENQMKEVALGYINGLKPEQVAFYADPEISYLRMQYIRLSFEKGLSLRKIYFFSGVGKKFGGNAMEEVYECFEQGLSMEVVKVLVDVSIQNYDIRQIYNNIKLAREIFECGCSLQDLQEISNTTSLGKNMTFEYVLEGLKNNISIENIKYYITTGHYYSSDINEIILGFKHGLTLEQVKLFSGHDFGAGTMRIVRLCLEYGMEAEYAQAMIENKQWAEMAAFIEAYENKETEETDLYGLIAGILN